MLPENIGARLRALREAKGMTRYRLGKIAKRKDGKALGETYIYRIENGLIKHPRSDTLQSLAAGLNVPLAQLIQETAPSETWALVEQSLKAYVPVYAGVGDMDPIDFVACTRAKVPMNTVRGYRIEGLSCEPHIREGDIIVVDSALQPQDGDLVLVTTQVKPPGGEVRIAQYCENGGAPYLLDAAGRHEVAEVVLQGIITESIHKLRKT